MKVDTKQIFLANDKIFLAYNNLIIGKVSLMAGCYHQEAKILPRANLDLLIDKVCKQ